MQVKQIAIVAAIASTFAMPMSAQASDIATLNGWGALFAAAHSDQQATAQGKAQGEVKLSLFERQQPPAAKPAPEPTPEAMPVAEPAPTAQAPEMEQPEAGDQTAATGDNVGESAEAGQAEMGQNMASASASLTATVNVSGEQMGQALNAVDGAYQTVGTMADSAIGSAVGTAQNWANMGSGATLAGDMTSAGSLNIADLASANMAGNLSATASMMNAGQMSAIASMTSSLIQNVIAARPASLSGLLR